MIDIHKKCAFADVQIDQLGKVVGDCAFRTFAVAPSETA